MSSDKPKKVSENTKKVAEKKLLLKQILRVIMLLPPLVEQAKAQLRRAQLAIFLVFQRTNIGLAGMPFLTILLGKKLEV